MNCLGGLKRPCSQAFTAAILSIQWITFISLLMITRSSFAQQILCLFAERPAEALNLSLSLSVYLHRHLNGLKFTQKKYYSKHPTIPPIQHLGQIFHL